MINNQNLAVLSEKVAYLEAEAKASSSASGITYDNTDSGLTADDVQEAIDEVKSLIPSISDLLVVESIGFTTESIPASSMGTYSATITEKTGYTGIGIAGYYFTGSGYTEKIMSGISVDITDQEVDVIVKNTSSDAQAANIYAYIIYAKNDII